MSPTNKGGDVLLLIGSAKRPRSTSESLGGYLLERLGESGFATRALLVHRALRSEESCEEMLAAVDACDILVLAFPLYVDSLPALLIRTLELVAERRGAGGTPKPQRLLVIVNCGFPETRHNETAIRICRRFAAEAGFEWAGGLALGGGEAISGQPLREVKGMARNPIRALELAADALAADRPVPEEAERLMAQPLVPSWLYTWMGSMQWRRKAKKHGVRNRLDERPYDR